MVLDLSSVGPAARTSRWLADYGATVVKVGPVPKDTGVQITPPFYAYSAHRRMQRALVDMKAPEGREAFLRMVEGADVLIESFRPGVVDRLGVGHDAVRAINPRIVYCTITGYGQTGPWRDHAGHDINYVATAGVLDQIGTAGGPPALPNFQIGDLLGGALTGLAGILAAVIAARATGQGRYVDVSMTDAVFAHAYSPLLAVLSSGRTAPRGTDALSGGMPGYGLYRTQDGRHLAVGALEPKFWRLFCTTLGRPDFEPYGLDGGREGARVKAQLTDMFARQPLAHWAALFAEVDCGVTPAPTFEEALAHPQLQARGMLVESDGLPQFAPPLKMSGFDFAVRRPAPKVGADSTAILREAGYAESEIAALQGAGVI